MKILPFAVSIIWGENFHYFVEYKATAAEAEAEAQARLHILARRKRKGPRPTAHVWRLVSTKSIT